MFNQLTSRRIAAIVIGALLTLLTACGTVQHTAKLHEDYIPPSKATISLGEVKNATGRTYDVDIEAMFVAAMTEALKEEGLLAADTETAVLTLNAKITEYEKGDAFKRWMMVGYGSTVLEVHCDLLVGDQIIGVADARRTIDAGGAYSIGAWESVYGQVATDVVEDVSGQLSRN